MNKQNFFYITNSRVPTQRAHGLQIAKMCEGFAKSFPSVHLVIPSGFNSITSDVFEYYNLTRNFQVKKLPTIYLNSLAKSLPIVWFWLKSISFAVSTFIFVLFYTTKDDLIYFRYDTSVFLVLLPFLKRRNITCEAHFLLAGWQKKMLLKAENIVVITSESKRLYDQEFDFEDKVFVAPDGISIADFDVNISKQEAREKLNLPQDKKLIIYTGYFYEWKGVDPLVIAAKQFNANEMLVLVGGAKEDTERIKEVIKREGVENIRLEGYRPYKEVSMYQKAADCLVLTASLQNANSKFFTSPLKLFEYMASERPIVASDTPSIREILNEDNSVLVLPDDHKSMLDGIRKALYDDVLTNKLVSKAKKEVVFYDWNFRAKNILEFILNRAKLPKVLYLFAGERRGLIERFKKGDISDSQLIGFNHLHRYGIRAYFLENKLINFLRKLHFHLAPWPTLFSISNYDILFVSSNLLFIFFVKKILGFKKPKIIFYNTFLTNTLKRNKGWLSGYIIRKAIRNSDMVICPSTAQKEFLVKEGFDEERICFIPNGVDAQFFKPPYPRDGYVLSIGKDMGRDYRTLIKAAGGFDKDIIIICAERNIPKDIVIPQNVKVIFGASQLEIVENFNKALFTVLPTYNEEIYLDASDCSGQYVLLETFAMGKAVIASERSTLSDYLVDGKSGVVVPAEDVTALRRAMEDLSHDEEKLNKFEKLGRNLIDEKCNTNKLAESLSIIFKNVCK